MKINKRLNGIFIAEYIWDLIHLSNKFNHVEEYLKVDNFKVLALQSFDSSQIDKIMDALYSDKKLLIDFDKERAKIIVKKDTKFEDSLLYYFNPDNLDREIQDGVDFYDIYNNNNIGM